VQREIKKSLVELGIPIRKNFSISKQGKDFDIKRIVG